MKIVISVLLIVSHFCHYYSAQQSIIDLGECKSEKVSKNGLAEIKKIIGEAKIVIIGEQLHGIGNDYLNFAIMVKFLHEEMGFNIILQEFSIYDFYRIGESIKVIGSAQEFRKAMYWPQALAEEMNPLLNYLDDQRSKGMPILMEGIDPRIFQRREFFDNYKLLVNPKKDKQLLTPANFSKHLEVLDRLLKMEYRDSLTTQIEKIEFLESLDTITQRMERWGYSPRLMQEIINIKSFAKNAWNLLQYPDNHPERYFERDQQMAANVIWFSEKMYPNEKIIVHLHNGHAAKQIKFLKGSILRTMIKKRKNTGTLLHDYFGANCFHIASSFHSGNYCGWDYIPKIVPKPHKKSIESKLHNLGLKYAFVKLNTAKKIYMFHSEFNTWVNNEKIRAEFGKMFDALIFIDSAQMPTKTSS